MEESQRLRYCRHLPVQGHIVRLTHPSIPTENTDTRLNAVGELSTCPIAEDSHWAVGIHPMMHERQWKAQLYASVQPFQPKQSLRVLTLLEPRDRKEVSVLILEC
jgi:hypothetical protein